MFKKTIVIMSLLLGCMSGGLAAAAQTSAAQTLAAQIPAAEEGGVIVTETGGDNTAEESGGTTGQASGQASDGRPELALNDAIVLSVDSSKAYVKGQMTRIDGINSGVAPFVEKGSTLVPLRFLADQVGAKMSFNAKTGDITITAGGQTAKTRIGERALYINDRKIVMSAPGQAVNGTTYLPLRNAVEDLFQKKLFFKDGIIVISDGEKSISGDVLASLKKSLQPKAIYAGELMMYYMYSDGTVEKVDIDTRPSSEIRSQEMNRVQYTDGRFFYIQDYLGTVDKNYFYRTDLNGNLKTFHFPQNEQLGLVMGQDGDLYFNRPNGDIVKIGYDDDTGARHVIGKGYLMKDNAYIKNDVIWFTDGQANYAIYKLQNGKKTKLSKAKSFISYVYNNWIYYGYYENKRWALYRMSMDGSHQKKLSGDADVNDSIIFNNKIYYLDNRTKTLREMNLDGSGKRAVAKLNDPGMQIFDMVGGTLYYTEENQLKWTQSLWKVDVLTGAKKRLATGELNFDSGWLRIRNVKALGNYVYYTFGDGVYAVKKNGGAPNKLGSLPNAGRDAVSIKEQ
ncbi:DUF5050 domain-containing protein [Paenibacillus macerans]|uniref:DUF5050 domain-containing protein n=1 Tax=Paenibacillus macerans TaxID=44252 RepID=UPI002E1AF73C|nr:DUF5050 domain-containing protein [Paenibacillus macerans]